MQVNYFNETIPDFSSLVRGLPAAPGALLRDPVSFNELFSRTARDEYSLQSDVVFKRFPPNIKKSANNKEPSEVKGLYIFIEELEPCYVGISRSIFTRIKQHMTGKSHYACSLAYLMAVATYETECNQKWMGTRDAFARNNFERYRSEIQKRMRDTWKIAIIPEADSYLLYLKEIYLACCLQTKWNSFATH